MQQQENSFVQAEILAGKIYPNPAKNEAVLNYKIGENEKGTVEMISIMGEKIASYILLPDELLKFNLTAISAGMYFYSIKINDEIVYTDKLIIIK